MFFLGLIILTLVAAQTKSETLTNRFFTLFDLLETIMDHELSDKRSHNSVEVNPVRNSSGALNPAGIILKSNPAAEQRGIISNGVKGKDLAEFKEVGKGLD